jgi:hypothetical protein
MRFWLLLLSALPALADDVPLKERRVWRGTVEVRAVGRKPADGEGREIQEERVEFVLVTEPPALALREAPIPFRVPSAEGSYRLNLDLRQGAGEARRVTQGEGVGRLYPRISGHVETGAGRYVLRITVTPATILAKTTLSGIDEGRFQTFRSVAQRRPFLVDFVAKGELQEGGRLLSGSRTLVDRRAGQPRDVTITWRARRMDPLVKGRVTDHLGRPVADLRVRARALGRKGAPPIVLWGVTGKDGRFEIEAAWGFWNVAVPGAGRDDLLYRGATVEGGAQLRIGDVPDLEVTVQAYVRRLLPEPQLLEGHFRGDVDRYLDHVRARAGEDAMGRALVSPPTER